MPGSELASEQGLRVTGPELGKDLAADLSFTLPAASGRRLNDTPTALRGYHQPKPALDRLQGNPLTSQT